MRKKLIDSTFLIGFLMMVMVAYDGARDEEYCGKIKYKIVSQRHSKYNSYDNPVFVINFDKKGIREITPSWNDFMSLNQGDRICYRLDVHDSPLWSCIGIIFAAINLVIFIIRVFIK